MADELFYTAVWRVELILDYQDFGFMECPIIHTQHIGLDMVDRGGIVELIL